MILLRIRGSDIFGVLLACEVATLFDHHQWWVAIAQLVLLAPWVAATAMGLLFLARTSVPAKAHLVAFELSQSVYYTLWYLLMLRADAHVMATAVGIGIWLHAFRAWDEIRRDRRPRRKRQREPRRVINMGSRLAIGPA